MLESDKESKRQSRTSPQHQPFDQSRIIFTFEDLWTLWFKNSVQSARIARKSSGRIIMLRNYTLAAFLGGLVFARSFSPNPWYLMDAGDTCSDPTFFRISGFSNTELSKSRISSEHEIHHEIPARIGSAVLSGAVWVACDEWFPCPLLISFEFVFFRFRIIRSIFSGFSNTNYQNLGYRVSTRSIPRYGQGPVLRCSLNLCQ